MEINMLFCVYMSSRGSTMLSKRLQFKLAFSGKHDNRAELD